MTVAGRATALRYMMDACSFTELRRTYPRPPFDAVWKLMDRLVAEGRLLSVELVLDELNVQDDEVAQWANRNSRLFLRLDRLIQEQARTILGTHAALVDLKKKKSSADPFLIAAAIVHQATVVTQEKPSGGPPKLKIPNVCAAYGVPCIPVLTVIQTEGL